MKYGGFFQLKFKAFGLVGVGGVRGVFVTGFGDTTDDEFAA